MIAWADGKSIQYRRRDQSEWFDIEPACTATILSWDWDEFEYRIKPNAKLRPWTADEVPARACRIIERELNAANARIAELKQELNESNETIRLQHKLITTAEKRCFDKYKEELTASNERIKRLKSFISEVARPWECTCRFTVWNLYNKKTAECDCCRAEGLLKEAKP